MPVKEKGWQFGSRMLTYRWKDLLDHSFPLFAKTGTVPKEHFLLFCLV